MKCSLIYLSYIFCSPLSVLHVWFTPCRAPLEILRLLTFINTGECIYLVNRSDLELEMNAGICIHTNISAWFLQVFRYGSLTGRKTCQFRDSAPVWNRPITWPSVAGMLAEGSGDITCSSFFLTHHCNRDGLATGLPLGRHRTQTGTLPLSLLVSLSPILKNRVLARPFHKPSKCVPPERP